MRLGPTARAALPGLLLLVQAFWVLAALPEGALDPVRYPDTRGYLLFGAQSGLERLAHHRTPGYPLFLHLASLPTGDHQLVPLLQLLLHFAAVALFYRGLTAFGIGRWPAAFAASPLIHANLIAFFGSALLTDAPGLSLAVLTIGAFFIALARPDGWTPLAGLATALFFTILVRPAYLFLIPLIPFLGMLLHPLAPAASRTGWGRRLGRLALAALLPFVLYGLARGVAVGHFGLVSYGGGELSGVTAPLMTPRMAARLDSPLRQLAETILAERARRGLGQPGPDSGFSLYDPSPEHYNETVHRIAWPAALALTGENRTEANRLLSALSRRVIQERPDHYLRWIIPAFAYGLCQTVHQDSPSQLFVLLAGLALLAARLAERGRRSAPPPGAAREVAVIALTALSFYLSGTVLVVLVEIPIERYMLATSIFNAAIPAIALQQLLSRLWRGSQPRSHLAARPASVETDRTEGEKPPHAHGS